MESPYNFHIKRFMRSHRTAPYAFSVSENPIIDGGPCYTCIDIAFYKWDTPNFNKRRIQIIMFRSDKEKNLAVDTEPYLIISADPKKEDSTESRMYKGGTYKIYNRNKKDLEELWDLLIQVDLDQTPFDVVIEWMLDKAPNNPAIPEHFRDRFLYLVSTPKERIRRAKEEANRKTAVAKAIREAAKANREET